MTVITMMPEDRIINVSIWNGIVVFASLLYLTGSVLRSTIIGIFVLISCALGFGARWLARGGFALGMVAIGVALGFPHPDKWSEIANAVPGLLAQARTLLASLH